MLPLVVCVVATEKRRSSVKGALALLMCQSEGQRVMMNESNGGDDDNYGLNPTIVL